MLLTLEALVFVNLAENLLYFYPKLKPFVSIAKKENAILNIKNITKLNDSSFESLLDREAIRIARKL